MKHGQIQEKPALVSASPAQRRPLVGSRGRNERAIPRVGPILLIAVIILVGLAQLPTLDVNPSSAPAIEFSADRAYRNVEILAASSRAIDLPGHETARQYLIDTQASMGIDAEVQKTTSVLKFDGADSFSSGQV